MMMSGINLANFVIVISAFIISALGLILAIFLRRTFREGRISFLALFLLLVGYTASAVVNELSDTAVISQIFSVRHEVRHKAPRRLARALDRHLYVVPFGKAPHYLADFVARQHFHRRTFGVLAHLYFSFISETCAPGIPAIIS